MRKKKKEGLIHKLIKLIHKIILGVVIVAVLNYILKFYYAGLAFLKWLVSFKYLILKAIAFWIWVKHQKHAEPVVHFEHAHHDFHGPHDSHEEYETSHDDYENHEHPYWGREDRAHEMAYSKQISSSKGSSDSWFSK
ncbi:unnamed protein product [Phaedon cochleariae]|uniref:Uncharacterized protein n=1 Tax=Phaedon cochleariae TaxID=80249 RepID=A0A9N9S8F6_PHACE|nr:unnamed protein product [Phaedon cochleariae]